MAAFRSASLCLIVCFLICSSEGQTNISADLGQDVILPCKVPNNNFRAVQWIRPDRELDYVLFYRNGHIDPDLQHPSYQTRVDLQDKEMKDGNFSLILKNVTKNDSGTYECLVALRGTNRKKRSGPKLVSSITLEVHVSGEKFEGGKGGIIRDEGNQIGGDISRGRPGAVVPFLLVSLVVFASLGFLMYKRHMKKNPNLPVPPDETTAEQIS